MGIGIGNPEVEINANKPAVRIGSVSYIIAGAKPCQLRNTAQKYRVVVNGIANGEIIGISGIKTIVEHIVTSVNKVQRLGVEFAVGIGGVSAVNCTHVVLFTGFIAAVVVFIHPQLDKGRRIVISINIADAKFKTGATHALIRINAVSCIICLAGPFEARARVEHGHDLISAHVNSSAVGADVVIDIQGRCIGGGPGIHGLRLNRQVVIALRGRCGRRGTRINKQGVGIDIVVTAVPVLANVGITGNDGALYL